MRVALRILVVAAIGVLAPAAAQETSEKPARPKPAPATAKEKASKRLLQDLAKIEANLKTAPHSYRGTLTFGCDDGAAALHNFELDFRGSQKGDVSWFFVDEWRVVQNGKRTAVVQVPEDNNDPEVEDAWQKPQGNSPDVPLAPALLVPHLRKAELSLPKPAEHDGRPALQIHARWRGRTATRALYATTVPSSQHEQILEALGRAAARDKKERFIVDAVMLYDPATRMWLASTMRFSYLDGRPIPDDTQPPPAPAGMPTLKSFPMVETIWYLKRCDAKEAALPQLNQRAQDILKVDAAGTPLPAEPKKPKKQETGKQNPGK